MHRTGAWRTHALELDWTDLPNDDVGGPGRGVDHYRLSQPGRRTDQGPTRLMSAVWLTLRTKVVALAK